MTAQNKSTGPEKEKTAAFYCRLSVDDDEKDMESNSIPNQVGLRLNSPSNTNRENRILLQLLSRKEN